jgi:hypothetical protein
MSLPDREAVRAEPYLAYLALPRTGQGRSLLFTAWKDQTLKPTPQLLNYLILPGGSSRKARTLFMAWRVEGSRRRFYLGISKQGTKSGAEGLTGRRPRQLHHLKPSGQNAIARIATGLQSPTGRSRKDQPLPETRCVRQ